MLCSRSLYVVVPMWCVSNLLFHLPILPFGSSLLFVAFLYIDFHLISALSHRLFVHKYILPICLPIFPPVSCTSLTMRKPSRSRRRLSTFSCFHLHRTQFKPCPSHETIPLIDTSNSHSHSQSASASPPGKTPHVTNRPEKNLAQWFEEDFRVSAQEIANVLSRTPAWAMLIPMHL